MPGKVGVTRAQLFAVLLVALWPFGLHAAAEAVPSRTLLSGPFALSKEEARLEELASVGKFRELDKLAEEYVRDKTRFPDGRFKASALNGVVRFYTAQELPFEQLQQEIQLQYRGWRTSNPRSALAAVSEAYVWYKYAWRLRGSGYASTVSQEGWKGFGEYLEKAEKLLLETKDYSSTLPTWYELMIEIQLTRDKQEMLRYYREGIEKYPWYFPLHFSVLRSLLPQWGASREEADKFITGIAAKEGDAMYARLYWSYSQGMAPGSMFKETKAKWPRMKKGFQALLKGNQNDVWTANNYAKFACEAGDKAAFRQADGLMNGDVDGWAWRQNLTYAFCKKSVGGG